MYVDRYGSSDINGMCMDETNSFGYDDEVHGLQYSNYDSLFGIGRNKQKKAEKKIAKAEKQLAKGHTKAAARKLAKGTKILNEIQSKQAAVGAAQQQIADIKATQGQLDANLPALTAGTNPNITEAMNTAPGQIGSETGATTMSSQAAQSQLMGGGGGDISDSGGMGDIPESTDSGGETSTPGNPTTLGGVTVSAGKTNWVLIIGGIIVVAVVIFIVLKMSKKK